MIPIPLRYILKLSSHLRLSIPKSPFPVGLPATILKSLLFLPLYLRNSPENFDKECQHQNEASGLWLSVSLNPWDTMSRLWRIYPQDTQELLD